MGRILLSLPTGCSLVLILQGTGYPSVIPPRYRVWRDIPQMPPSVQAVALLSQSSQGPAQLFPSKNCLELLGIVSRAVRGNLLVGGRITTRQGRAARGAEINEVWEEGSLGAMLLVPF